ncbi:MAG: dihydrodipicolinate synthase family protein [Candidatus Solibacter usitatus]|nr:dihydrodipicolinate synthase family protein [Candidatus Solibacter usitatus]
MNTRRAFLATVPAAAFAAASKLPTAEGPQFIVAMLTMLDGKGRLDDAMNKDYLAYLAAGGADGALVMGTTGEFASFSVKERKQSLESAMKHKGRLNVMCQIGAGNLPETLELLDHATGSGADSVLVLPPYYYKNPSADGLASFFEPVLRAAKLPVLVYNIPQLSGSPITPELLRKLSSFDRLYGMKDSFSKADAMVSFLREFPKLRIMTGVHGNIEVNLKNRGAGGLTGNGSIFVKETAEILKAHSAGGDTAAAQKKLNELSGMLSGYDGVPAMKYALSLMGLKESAVRAPFVPVADAKRKELAEKIARWRS